jgi:oxygen-independent coproporphyrinogen-3 oxidase
VVLAPDHFSIYQLTYEPGTPLTRRKERGEIQEISEEEARGQFLLAREVLEKAGYAQYEVSAYARSADFESRHNKKYWEEAPYLGIGPSAHSYRGGARSWNLRGTREYIEALAGGRDPEAGREVLTAEEKRLERLALGLRTARGLRLDRLREELGSDLRSTHGALLDELVARGLLLLEDGVLRPTAEGLAVADEIALRLGYRA